MEPTPAGTLVWHGGQWPVYSGLLLHVPAQDLTLAVLANSWHLSRPYYAIGTGTVLYNAVAASFLRNLVLPSVPGEGQRTGPSDDASDSRRTIPAMPWTAPAGSLARIGARLDGSLLFFWGAELFGRGLLAREAGESARADSLMGAAVACCPEALLATTDLGLLFHLGRSDDPRLRAIGQAAGEDLLARRPGDDVSRFNLAVSYVQDGSAARARSLLEGLIGDDAAQGWVRGWAAYLLAEQLADQDPARARRLLRGILESGVDESGLRADSRALLDSLGG